MGSSRARSLTALAAVVVVLLASTACSRVAQKPPSQPARPPAKGVAAPGTAPGTNEPAEPETAPSEAASDPADGRMPLDSDKGEKFGYLKRVWKVDSLVYVTVDYAEMFTGEQAAVAAEAHGDESPPPNDYYIVNDNAKLRTFQLAGDAAVSYLPKPEPQPQDLDGAEAFVAKWDAPGADELTRALPYRLTVDGSTITKLEQVFLP